MKTLNNFPHPLLIEGGFDYVDCSFELFTPENVKTENEKLSFDLSYGLTCESLNKLIAGGEARVIVKIYSPKTTYRNAFEFNNNCSLNIEIPINDVAEKIEIHGSIIADNPIAKFCPDECNKDLFGTTGFDIRKADILAMAKKVVILLETNEYKGAVASIFNISINPDLDNTIQPNFDDESGKINIHLDEKTHYAYSLLRAKSPELKRYLSAVIVFPVLIEALSLMKSLPDVESEYEDKRWYRMIRKKLTQKNINLKERGVTEVANELLGGIVQEALISFSEKMTAEFDEELADGGAD